MERKGERGGEGRQTDRQTKRGGSSRQTVEFTKRNKVHMTAVIL